MSSATRYWCLVRIDATGTRKVDEILAAKVFFERHFGDYLTTAAPDRLLERQLIQLVRQPIPVNSPKDSPENYPDRALAQLCLRCSISHLIEQACIQLEMKYGSQGFTRYDLFPLVLEDDGRPLSTPAGTAYRRLAIDILDTFEPERAGLGTWVMRRVHHHPELQRFLLQHGIYLASDWAILNDTTPKQVRRILAEFYALTATEVEQAYSLLESYHAIYRHDRLLQRQAGQLNKREECRQPTSEQLSRMGQFLRDRTTLNLSNHLIWTQLLTLAKQLRNYRICVRGGKQPTESLDQIYQQMGERSLDNSNEFERVQLSANNLDIEQEEQTEFLAFYRQQLLNCLHHAIETATEDRYTYLCRKKPQTAQQFLEALYRFHCQGQAMGEIASQLGLQAQYQVSRLMNLKDFRANIRQRLLVMLYHQVLDKAKLYADPDQLQKLDNQLETAIEAALDEQITALIQQAETEASVARHCPLTSLFARRLCHHLENRRSVS